MRRVATGRELRERGIGEGQATLSWQVETREYAAGDQKKIIRTAGRYERKNVRSNRKAAR